MADLVDVTDNSFDAEVLKCDIPVLAGFLAEWAAPSQAVAAHLAEIATEYEGRLKIVKLDIEANPMVTSGYNVLNVPTLILFKYDQEVARVIGVVSKAEVLDRVLPFLDE
jgi:thioredoxin 1